MDSQPAKGADGVLSPDTRFAGKLASVNLIPWDPDSADHVKRMKQQRVACGWKHDHVEAWRDYQRDGKLGFYWIAVPPSHSTEASLVHKHITEYPAQSSPLQDTATAMLLHSRASSAAPFHPIGHVCLDGCAEHHENDTLGISPADGIYAIAAFYVSSALQSVGIGSVAISTLERTAAKDFGAKRFTLNTLSREDSAIDSPRRIAMNRPTPKTSPLDWYERRGYEIYDTFRDENFGTDSTGKVWPATLVYLKKDISLPEGS